MNVCPFQLRIVDRVYLLHFDTSSLLLHVGASRYNGFFESTPALYDCPPTSGFDLRQTDLPKVYEDLYREDIVNKMVEERVAEKEKELRTRSISTPGKQVLYKPSDKIPKSFEEANQMILDKRAAEGTLE